MMELPKTLSEEGFLFAQVEVPENVAVRAMNLPFEYHDHDVHRDSKYGMYPIGTSPELTSLLPWDLSGYNVRWMAKDHVEGFYLHPHRAYHGDNMEYQGPAMILLWICSDNYHGREYVYGEFTDINFSQKIWAWEDEHLVEKGRIRPKTGTICVMDRLDYKWWHGVTKQQSGRVITLIAELGDRRE